MLHEILKAIKTLGEESLPSWNIDHLVMLLRWVEESFLRYEEA